MFIFYKVSLLATLQAHDKVSLLATLQAHDKVSLLATLQAHDRHHCKSHLINAVQRKCRWFLCELQKAC
jgi:hypothetical protein